MKGKAVKSVSFIFGILFALMFYASTGTYAFAATIYTAHITYTGIEESIINEHLNPDEYLCDGDAISDEDAIPKFFIGNYYGDGGLISSYVIEGITINGTRFSVPETGDDKVVITELSGIEFDDGHITIYRMDSDLWIEFSTMIEVSPNTWQEAPVYLADDLTIEVAFREAHTHSPKIVAETPATCTDPGTEAYWKCSDPDCGKMFSDEAGTTEITEPTVIPAKGHSLQKTEAKAATTSAAGNSEYYTCGACGKFFSDAAGANEIAKDSWVIAKLEEEAQPTPTTGDDDKSAASKAKGKIVIKAKSKKAVSIKAGKAVKVSKAIKVTKNLSKGKVTYKKVKGNKKITIENGKIKVKKGLKKGKVYTIKVKATSAAKGNYKAATSKAIALKIKVE